MRFGYRPTLVVGSLTIALFSAHLPAQQQRAGAQPQAGSDALGQNAALRYWQAFAHLPKLDERRQKLVSMASPTSPVDLESAALTEEGRDALLYLRRGAAIPRCDWGLHPEDGPNLLLPHLAKGRDLARLAVLRARVDFTHGETRAGVDAAADAMTLGRHLSTDLPTIISYLVQLVVERVAIEALAAHLGGLDPAALEHLEARLNDLPAGGSIGAAFRAERESFTDWAVGRLRGMNDADPWKQKVLGVMSEAGADLDALIAASGGTREAVARRFEGLRAYFEKLAKLLPLPPDEFQKELAALNREFDANPLSKAVLPSVQKVYDRDAAGRTRMTLLKAAVAVARGGPERAAAFKDASGAPVEYVATDGGFELRSTVVDDGKPVTLKVGGLKK